MTDAQRLIGKWEGISTLEFYSNGDFRDQALLVTWNGKWKILEGNRLELKYDSSLAPDVTWDYSFSGDKLTLTFPAGLKGSNEYKRIK
jgi:hypothetical protein